VTWFYLLWWTLRDIQNDRSPFLPLKPPDPRNPVLATGHEAAVIVCILDAINPILAQQNDETLLRYKCNLT